MVDWTSGYVADVDYSYGYYRELHPGLLEFACLSAGVAPPTGDTLTYLELGYGRGLSLNIHSAANDGVYWGTDFNPNHALEALSLAGASGSGVRLLDDSFADLAARTDLPDFDIIGLHGIWSWISPENRNHIVDLIRRRLKQGGLVYISYNCFPGWAPAEPLKHLIGLHGQFAGSEAAGSFGKLDLAVKFARDVVDAGALYFKQNPAVVKRLEGLGAVDRNYAAHEYLAHDWHLMAFSEVARILGEAKLGFAASAHLLDHVDALNVTADGMKVLKNQRDPVLYQSVRDYLLNQQFRRDIFVKGVRRLTALERMELLQQRSFVLSCHPDEVPTTVQSNLGQATLQDRVYKPLVSVLSENGNEPKSLTRMFGHPWLKSIARNEVIEGLTVLMSMGVAHLAVRPSAAVLTQCSSLNRYAYERARIDGDLRHLASPISGTGITVGRMEQLMLSALADGKRTPADQAQHAWGVLSRQNQRIVKDGKSLETAAENIAELTVMAQTFNDKRLAGLTALGIA
jgi:SAM-dependent methyltransferase